MKVQRLHPPRSEYHVTLQLSEHYVANRVYLVSLFPFCLASRPYRFLVLSQIG